MRLPRVIPLAAFLLAASCVSDDGPTGPDDEVEVNEPLFAEDFEQGLGQWSGRSGGHHAEIVADPLSNGNLVVRFTRPVAAGDIFSPPIQIDPDSTYTLTFYYLGLATTGSTPDHLGGFIGIADEIGGVHSWLGGTDTAQAPTHLIDDDAWHSYSITFVPSHFFTPADGQIHITIEDWEGHPGVGRDAYFDLIRFYSGTVGG